MAGAQRGFIAPQLDPESTPWWEALRAGSFTVPECAIGHTWFPAAPACPHCGDTRTALRPVSGRGSVYSWVVTRRALSPAFAEDVPYTVVAVDLDEGPRVIARLIGDDGSVTAGMAVRATVYEVSGQPLLGFQRV